VAEAEDVVRLMTIHKAKGLEFPVVVLPDLSAGRKPFRDALLHRPDLGLTLRPADAIAESAAEDGGEEGEEPKALSCLLARALETEDLRKEDIRRLYVGATRAQDHLIFVGADRRSKDGAFRDPGGHLNVMGRYLDLAARAPVLDAGLGKDAKRDTAGPAGLVLVAINNAPVGGNIFRGVVVGANKGGNLGVKNRGGEERLVRVAQPAMVVAAGNPSRA
jgi:superfamily I DNA/RNA helicase